MQNILHNKKIAFLTLGCKVNACETEQMQRQCEEAGAIAVDFDDMADVYVVNTCTVTNIADKKSGQMLRGAKRRNPEALVVATGCYVDKSYGAAEISADMLLPNDKKNDIVSVIAEALTLPYTVSEQSPLSEDIPISAPCKRRTRAFFKIQDGCNRYCSYCIIPYVRPKLTSLPLGEAISGIEDLVAQGYREIVLTGIHLSSYATHEGGIIALLQAVDNLSGDFRIRLSSMEPMLFTEDFARALSLIERLCPSFHLSLQSGSDSVLARMNRRYATSDYVRAVDYLRKYYVRPAITTDIIVGFPGETEAEFGQTMDFVRRVGFARLHVFKYSARKGTVAAAMPGQLAQTVKHGRSEQLIDIGRQSQAAYLETGTGGTAYVLFEQSCVVDGKKYLRGYSERYERVLAEAEADMSGLLVPVRLQGIVNVDNDCLGII